MQSIVCFSKCAGLVLALSWVGGCNNSGTSPVSGKVTMDGQPLEDAVVQFHPKAGGRPIAGRTDGKGNYQVVYGRGVKGAIPGEYAVFITTHEAGDADGETEEQRRGKPEKVPAKYNVKSTLIANVESRGGKFDFDLDSDGPIIVQAQGAGY